MKKSTLTAFALTLIALAAAQAQTANPTEFPASLAGHALLPAPSFLATPADAPADLRVSGKFTTGVRVERLDTIEGRSANRPTGISLPMAGQPLQGHSGIKRMSDGSYWVLTDNGFGSKANSPDSMLFLNRYSIDWANGVLNRQQTIFLHDPDKKVPFRIVHEGTPKRYLTGSDFDTESFQIAGGNLWIGDELGPWLIKADMNGKVLAVFETQVDGKPARSPDHPAIATPAMPSGTVDFTIRRSRGYEGMASSPDGKKLYALLEGPAWDAAAKDWEKLNGREYLRVLEFDVATEKWTGRHWKYVLEANGLAIGDFNMIDATTALVIERDNGEGTPDKACPTVNGAIQRAENCFHDLPKLKRVYKIEMTEANVNNPVRKIGFIDLLAINDPQNLARKPKQAGKLAFPFFTIENVDIVDADHIIVGNDNNLPFSSSREPNQADDNEFVLLRVRELLQAK
ncbi:esterase-like activity of phytase family protein [Variovorax sp. PCZ-1]|uniref:esterase-like activity of phytase family protein n=1 Tax=Variovorax sp. PCZ-1 TaxID=2835533 RepID=UPI001BCC001A|nr:esterase-like activity of phytase family protein [Variovorax sp. PCZ-1]MBS7806794.1 esterase-like activity of phytase family protein [Variovorax sp. PCZ-1]